jgi:hypothetical protein
LYHFSDGLVKVGLIVKYQYDIKYFKNISYNIKECLYIILISKRIYKYSPPLPSKIPVEITNKLKAIIEKAFKELVNILPQKLVLSKYYLLFNFLLNIIYKLIIN